jgi:hypothetical protein
MSKVIKILYPYNPDCGEFFHIPINVTIDTNDLTTFTKWLNVYAFYDNYFTEGEVRFITDYYNNLKDNENEKNKEFIKLLKKEVVNKKNKKRIKRRKLNHSCNYFGGIDCIEKNTYQIAWST